MTTCAGLWGWDWYRARREWRRAEEALSRHDLPAAANHLDHYIRLRPQDTAGWFQAARTARRRGQFVEADHYLDQYQQAGGAMESIDLERDLAAVQQGQLGEIDIRLRSTIEPNHPDVVFVLEALARGYLAVGRLADAREACDLWKAVDPGNPSPWLWLGWISERLSQIDQATELFHRALELAPEDRDAHLAVARMLVRKRQPVAAAEHYEWVLGRVPDDSEAILGLAECRIDQGRPEQAIPLIDRVLKSDPASSVGLFLRGKAAMVLEEPSKAESWLRSAVGSRTGDPEALHLLILSLRAQRKDLEAERLGVRLEQLRDDVRRLSELIRKIGPNLDDAMSCHEAGIIALRLGRAKDGLNLLHEALRRKGDHRLTHEALAKYYREAGPAHLAEFHERLAGHP